MNPKIQDDEQIREYINRIIDHELNKPDPNMNMINAYSAILNYREGGKYTLDPKKRKEELKKLSRAYKEASRQHEPEKRIMPIWSKCLLKAGTVICSIILIIGMSVFTISAFNGVSPSELLSNLGKAIFQWKTDEPVEINSMTFIRNGEIRQYTNIEECLQLENLDIYYPSWLPDGVYIESVIVSTSNNTNTITLKLNTDEVLLGVYTGTLDNDDYLSKNYNKIDVDGRIAYYIERDDKYYTKIELEGYIYTITTTNIEVVEKLLSGLIKE